jgi:SSS family solute:Na+ symporter
MVRFLIPQFIGICALTYLWNDEGARALFFHGDGTIIQSESLRAIPVFLSQLLPAGLIGLVGAGMIAVFISTHDTYLLCWASVLAEDVVNPCTGGKLSQKMRLRITRVFLFVIAGFLLVWSMWFELSQDLWDYMAVSKAIYFTGAFAVLLAGLYWKRASKTGAYLTLGAGVCALLGLKPIQSLIGVRAQFEAAGS